MIIAVDFDGTIVEHKISGDREGDPFRFRDIEKVTNRTPQADLMERARGQAFG